jgi:hypothetical protein
MSGHGRDWAELASQRERFIGGCRGSSPADNTAAQSIAKLTDMCTVTSGWTELASRNERLVDPGDPHFRLTSPAPHGPVRVAAATKDRLAG